MAKEYSDYVTQNAYESGIKDTFEELFPGEPPQSAREWWDNLVGSRIENQPPIVIVATPLGSGPDYTREEMEQMQREMIGDAMDEQMNWPHR